MGCLQPFTGRADAKTCSAKCRKRFQRTREMALSSYELKYYPPAYSQAIRLKPNNTEGAQS